MKFIKPIFFTIAIIAIALAVNPLQVKPVSNASAAISHLQQEDVFQPTIDTYVASGPQWANNPRGESAGLFVGYGDSEAFDLERSRTFIQFDLTSLAGKLATGPATLRLYLAFATFKSPGESMTIELHKVTQPWDNQTTWNNQPLYEPTVIASQVVNTDVDRWIEWQIPATVIQDWINNPTQNYGIALVSPNGETPGRHIRNFHSKEHENGRLAPELRVQSAVPTPVPATATPRPTATPTPPPARLSLEVDNQPSGEVTWGDQIIYTISYRNTSEADTTINNVVLTGLIPDHTTLTITPVGASVVDNQLILNIGYLTQGEGGQKTYAVQLDTPISTTKSTSLRTVGPTPPVIINCVTGTSDQTSPVEVCAHNGGSRLWIPIVSR